MNRWTSKTYAAGMNYTLHQSPGDGFAMFDGAELIRTVSEDYLVMSTYAADLWRCRCGSLPHLTTANSPRPIAGYLLDYENPYGAGHQRICIAA